jgi:cytochrome c peroxidase
VEPYVHELGARTPSLRRLYKKWPYFTNGSAKSLADVLARARFQGEGFWHDGGPKEAAGLGEEERRALLAWLDLL